MAVRVELREGVEFKVEDGVGFIDAIETTPGKRNARVVIRAKHLRQPLAGWADGTDAGLVAALRAGLASKAELPYRIEVVRDRSFDPAVPFAEVPKESKFRRLVAFGPDAVAADPWATDAGDPFGETPPAPPVADGAGGVPERAPEEPGIAPPLEGVPEQPGALENALAQLARAAREHNPPHEVRAHETIAVDLGASADQIRVARTGVDVRTVLNRLWTLARDGVPRDAEPVTSGVALARLLGAEEATVNVALARGSEAFAANGPRPPQPPSDLARGALARAQDPDGVAGRAPAPYNGDGPRPGVSQRSGLGTAGASTPRGLQDPKPWQRTHDSGPLAGRLNLSSYEFGEVAASVVLAQRILIRRARALAEETDTAVAPPDREETVALAKALVLAADRVQVAVRGGAVDRQAGLYRRATWAVKEAVDWYPVPPADAGPDAMAGWHAAVVEQAVETLTVALELLGETVPPAGSDG